MTIPKNRKPHYHLVEFLISLTVILILLTMSQPNFLRVITQTNKVACINQMRIIFNVANESRTLDRRKAYFWFEFDQNLVEKTTLKLNYQCLDEAFRSYPLRGLPRFVHSVMMLKFFMKWKCSKCLFLSKKINL